MLAQAFTAMASWGSEFKTAGHWVKRTRHGKLAFGTGYILRSAGEPFLIGTRGAPKCARTVRSIIKWPIREHTRKPDKAFAAAEALIPAAESSCSTASPAQAWPAGVKRRANSITRSHDNHAVTPDIE